MRIIRDLMRKIGFDNAHVKEMRDLYALGNFILDPEGVRTISNHQSLLNIYSSLVEIVAPHGHHSNGLLVTNNGYFITAYHCVDDLATNPLRIRCQDGQSYPIDKVCVIEKNIDLALAKASIPEKGHASPQAFKFYCGLYPKGIEVFHLSRWDGKCLRKKGSVTRRWVDVRSIPREDFFRHFDHEVPIKNGDSGGVYVSNVGEVMGIASMGYEEVSGGTAARWSDALVMVREYLDYKHQKAELGHIPWNKGTPAPQVRI